MTRETSSLVECLEKLKVEWWDLLQCVAVCFSARFLTTRLCGLTQQVSLDISHTIKSQVISTHSRRRSDLTNLTTSVSRHESYNQVSDHVYPLTEDTSQTQQICISRLDSFPVRVLASQEMLTSRGTTISRLIQIIGIFDRISSLL